MLACGGPRHAPRSDPRERVVGIDLESDAIFRNLEHVLERVRRDQRVTFTRLHAGGDVLEGL